MRITWKHLSSIVTKYQQDLILYNSSLHGSLGVVHTAAKECWTLNGNITVTIPKTKQTKQVQ